MEALLPWFNLIACILLLVGCLTLYLDGLGKRKARAQWEAAVDARLDDHDARLVGHAARLLILEGGGQPPPAGSAPRPSLSLARSALQEERAAAPRSTVPQHSYKLALDRTLVSEGVVSPFAPDPAPVSSARMVESSTVEPEEARYLQRLAELDDELGPEGKEAIRRRIEVAEDERDRARAASVDPPLAEDDGRATSKLHESHGFDDADEQTVVKDGGAVRAAVEATTRAPMLPLPLPPPPRSSAPVPSRRATLLGGMGGAPRPALPAIVLTSGNMRRGERVMSRFYNLAVHHKAKHCAGPTCEPSGGVCACTCDECALRRTLLAQAERETLGE